MLERSLAPDHPAAQGHFPGNPIIPGAVLLAETVQAIAADLGVRIGACRIRLAKFPHPARPGAQLAIAYSGHAEERIRFTCTVGDATVLSGEVLCVPPAP